MAIYCCGRYNLSNERLELPINDKYKDRILEICTCPVCNKVKAILTQTRIIDNKIVEWRPKKGKTTNFINKYRAEALRDLNKAIYPKGKYNHNWIYADGKKNIAKDFNEHKKFSIKSEIDIL